MKKIKVISIIFFISCKAIAPSQNIQGQYKKIGKDYQYELSLNTDNSFLITKKYFDGQASCKGKWQFLTNDTILLKCNEATISEKLGRGYISQREQKIIVLNKNKLQIDEIILKRSN